MKALQTKAQDGKGSARTTFFGKTGHGVFQSGRSAGSFFSPMAGPGRAIQMKLNVGAPNDVYEKEANQMADKVVQRCASCGGGEGEKKRGLKEKRMQRKAIFESEEAQPVGEVVQRCPACDAEEGIRRKGEASDIPSVPMHLEHGLQRAKGQGNPLSEGTRTQMESAFGANFGGVRVHTDAASIQMNKDLNAQAFTYGSDIYFNSGRYDAAGRSGRHLLAHELTHVVQQSQGSPVNADVQTDLIDIELVGPTDSYTVAQTGDVIKAGEAAGPRILLRIELGSGGTVTLTWHNFATNGSETGDLRTWLIFRSLRGFYPYQDDFDALSTQLTPAQWRSLGNDPVLKLLDMNEKGTIHMSDAVILSSYKGMIYTEAKATLDRNEAQIDDLLGASDRVKKIQEYSDGLKEASMVRDSLVNKKEEIKIKIAPRIDELEHSLAQQHSFSFGFAGNIQNMDTFRRLRLLQEEDRVREPIKRIDAALEFWKQSFPLLTRLETNEINSANVEATLRSIKENIVKTRPRLDDALVGKGSLDLMELDPVRQHVNTNLGKKATAVVEAEDKRNARFALAGGLGLMALSILLLFIPGGVFIDVAIGIAIAAKSVNDAFVIGTAANTGLDVDDGLMSQAQAQGAKFNAILSVILAAAGAVSAGFKVLRIAKLYRAIGEVSPELSFASKAKLSRLIASNPDLLTRLRSSGELAEALEKLGSKLSTEELLSIRNLLARAHGVPRADVPLAKFKDYIFKPGATHGKEAVFKSLGYDASHSQELVNLYETQAMAKFKAGAYTLGKADQYGQRINIVIDLPGIGPGSGKSSRIISGWMMNENNISLNTPFSGFAK